MTHKYEVLIFFVGHPAIMSHLMNKIL